MLAHQIGISDPLVRSRFHSMTSREMAPLPAAVGRPCYKKLSLTLECEVQLNSLVLHTCTLSYLGWLAPFPRHQSTNIYNQSINQSINLFRQLCKIT